MRRATAALLALGVLTAPATAFDPDSTPPAPGARFGEAPEEPAKIQDRIAPGDPLRLAFLPEFQLRPRSEPAPRASVPPPPARSPYGWDAALDARIAMHAASNGVPIELARRVVKRESGGNPRAVSNGNYGLMQIRLGTAKAMGYRGNAQGLLDADTNMIYAMKYLSGALRAAKGNHDRAIRLYARGYYPEAKKMGFSPYEAPRAAGLTPATATR